MPNDSETIIALSSCIEACVIITESLTESNLLHYLFSHQTSLTVQFKPLEQSQGVSYKLQWREYSQTWDTASTGKAITASLDGSKTKAVAEDLQPGTTYCLRLTLVSTGQEKVSPGPELIIDTEQVGCTPKSSGGCAVL